MIKVSVVVNTVDRPEDLRRCLLSVLNQSFRDFEIVVVNNGVGGETDKLLDEFKAKSSELNIPFKIISDKTKKLSYLFNVGWKNASPLSTYFAYCADDTEPSKDWLREAVEFLEKNSLCGGVSGPTISTTNPPGEMFYLRDLAKKNIFTRIFLRLYEYFVMEDRTMDPGYWPQSGAFTMGAGIPLPHIKEPMEIDLLTSGNMVATRTAMMAVGGFDENFYFNHADGDLYIRMKKAGFKMIFHPKVSVLHHMRFGPTRYPWILGRDTAFYYLKDVRPKSLRGWIGAFMNLSVFNGYFIFKALQLRKADYLKGISGFLHGVYDFFATKSSERNEVLKTLLPIAVFVLLFGQAVRKGFVVGMPAFGDGWPFPPTVIEALKNFFSSWDLRNPGITMPVQPVISVLTAFEALAGSPFLGNMIIAARLFYFYLPLPLMFISMYWFLGKFLKSKTARFVASFIYGVNFFTIGELLGGFVPTLYVQVLFPLILYSLYRRRLFNFSLLFAAAFVLSDHVVLFIVPFFLVYVLWRLISEGLIGFIKSGFFIVSAVVIVVLLTLHYTFYYFNLALPFLGGGSLRSDVLEFLIGNVRDTYRDYGFTNIVRLGGNYLGSLYSLNPFILRLGFVIPVLSFAWVLFPANWKKRRLLAGFLFSFLSLFTIVLIHLTHKFITIPTFIQFPFLFRFRNPSRPTLFLVLAYTPLIALTVDGCISFVRNKTYPKVLTFIVSGVGVLALVALALYSKPFFSGDYTFSKNRGTTYTIPEYYYEVGSWLKTRRASEGQFRTLWLPYNHEEAEIKIRYVDPLSYSVPINYGAYTTNEYLTNMKETYLSLDKLATDSAKLLAKVGVKYVVINTNAATAGAGRARFEYGYQTPWLSGAPGAWEVAIVTMGGFKLEKDLGLFKIYENLDYRADTVDPVLAGRPPSNIRQLQFTKNVLIAGAFIVLVLSVYMAARELKKMNPLKVALINNFPPYSGTGRVAYELFKNLRRDRSGEVEVDLFCTHFMRRGEASWDVNREVKFLHGFAYKEHENLSRALIYFVDPYRIPQGYNIYHVTNHMLGWFAAVRRPSVVTVHDVLQFKYREKFGSSLSSLIYNYLMDNSIKSLTGADHLISVSGWSADQVSKILNIPREKISVVYNGLDHELFYPREKWESRKKLNLPLDAKIIINLGSEIKRKNLITLFKSLRLIVDKNPKIILLRVGEKTPAIAEIIENFGLSRNVSYLNFVPEESLPFVYSSADVLVIPSLEEGFGFPVIEAQACGVPVIASRRSSLPEIGGSDCFYIEKEEDEALLAEMISDVISAPLSRLGTIIESGIENAGKFSWERNARETLSVYQEVLSKNGKIRKLE